MQVLKYDPVTKSHALDKVDADDCAPGVAATTKIHEQDVASALWVVNHGLNKFPSIIQCLNSAGEELWGTPVFVSNSVFHYHLESEDSGILYYM